MIPITNKTLAQIWFGVMAIAFGYGFYCGIEQKRIDGWGFALIQLSSLVLSVWGMYRLWRSKPAK